MSVAALAPKGKTYSMTNSLLARVSIAAGVSNAGHEQFWKNVAAELEFTFDSNFISQLKYRDRKKVKARVVQRTKEGKKKRSQAKYAKQNDAHKTQLDSYKEGMFYESGVAVALAKRTLKTVARNPKGTPDDQLKCSYYHPSYCNMLGHKSCGSPLCGMKKKSKEERASALKIILAEQVDLEVKKNAVLLGTFFWLNCTTLYILCFSLYLLISWSKM